MYVYEMKSNEAMLCDVRKISLTKSNNSKTGPHSKIYNRQENNALRYNGINNNLFFMNLV